MLTVWIIAVALLGFLNALYIYVKKKHKQKLLCFIGSDCNKVIGSKYGTLFGFDNTLLGMVYYAFLILALLFTPFLGISSFVVLGGLRIAAGGAALMSLYLLYIQLIVLKEWCDYCLIASLINILIAITLFLY